MAGWVSCNDSAAWLMDWRTNHFDKGIDIVNFHLGRT